MSLWLAGGSKTERMRGFLLLPASSSPRETCFSQLPFSPVLPGERRPVQASDEMSFDGSKLSGPPTLPPPLLPS